MGEYTALAFAGVMEFDDGLEVVQRRGQAMQEAADASPSGMVSVLGLQREQVEDLCEQAGQHGVLRIANLLCPGNIVVSGDNVACEKAAELADQMGAMKAVPLPVAGAFHTELMQPAVAALTEALAGVQMRPPEIPVVSNVDAKTHSEPNEIRDLLVQQVCSPVLWEESMRYLLGEGFDQFYEVGPGRVARGLLRRIDRKVACQCVLDA